MFLYIGLAVFLFGLTRHMEAPLSYICWGAYTIFIVLRLTLFFKNGGTFILAPRNLTYLYMWAKIVYPKAGELEHRLLALYANTANVRDKFPLDRCCDFVRRTKTSDWKGFASLYAFLYSSAESQIGTTMGNKFQAKAEDAIQKAMQEYRNKGAKYENVLRSIPQSILMVLFYEINK